jgi:ribonucleoside-diphosphate reductase alpha chain
MSIEEKVEQCIDWEELAKTVGIAIQALDNVVEFNFYPYPDAERNSHDLRPLGLGIMGFASLLIHLHISYDSKEATIIADKLGEFMYAKALEKSKELAKVRGPFRDYPEREYPYEERRNILLLAIAPTASISLLAGVSSGIDSHFAMVYSREIQFGKFTVVVGELIEELKRLGIWNEEIKNRIVAA